MAALLQNTLSNLGRGTSDESKGLTTASSLVQSLSGEVAKSQTTREVGEQKFGLLYSETRIFGLA